MTKRFEITVNAEADHHLGVNITKLPDGSLKLTQMKLLNNIFEECSGALHQLSLSEAYRIRDEGETRGR